MPSLVIFGVRVDNACHIFVRRRSDKRGAFKVVERITTVQISDRNDITAVISP
jgi:hypothetical protein